MRKVEFIETEDAKNRKKIKDAVLGFQHSILITEDNEAYGCGKTDSYQIQPYRYHHYKDIITVDKIQKPELIWNRRRVIKAACGYRHSIFLTEDQKLYGLGLNKFGQCGADYLEHPHLTRATEIFFPYRQNETIIDIKCGSNHTLILTNLGLYFMGGVYNNQNPFLLYNENVSSPSVLNLDKKVIKIFANFDRSAIITEDGKALLFGGKDMSKIGGESGQLETIDEFKFDKDSLIGLGFSHTIIVP